MTRRTRWGIAGTGKIASIMSAAIARSSTSELVAVASRSAERADAFARAVSAPRSFGSYEDVARDPDVDIVYVANTHPEHVDVAIAATWHGKHVLCEKPLAINEPDAARIVQAAREAGVFLAEAFAYRFHPQTRRLEGLISSGAIGIVHEVDATFGYAAGSDAPRYLHERALGGGSILDVGCYTTSMAHLVARAASDGKPCGSIAVAGAGDLSPSGIDRSATATIAFANGVRARVACAINADLESTVTIRGDEGWIEVRSPWLPGWIPGPAVIAVEREGAHQDIEVVADRDPYVIEVEAVAELIHEGTLDPPAMPAVESLANMRTLDRWRDVIGVVYDADEERHAATSRVIEGPV